MLDIWRERAEFPQLNRAIEMLATKWSPDRLLVEDKASGQSLIQELRNNTRLPAYAIKTDSDKVSRANAVTPMVETGRVYLPESAEWLSDFVDELSAFPSAPHDDQVDALAQALNYTRRSGHAIAAFFAAQLTGNVGNSEAGHDETNRVKAAYEEAKAALETELNVRGRGRRRLPLPLDDAGSLLVSSSGWSPFGHRR